MTRRRPTPRQVDDWVIAYEDGESLRSIAATSRCSHEAVRRHIRARGVTLRPARKVGRLHEFGRRFEAAYLAGESSHVIAARYAVSHDAVVFVLRRRGVRIRGPYERVRVSP